MDFASLRKKGKDFAALAQQIEDLSKTGGFEADPRFWKPTTDKAGNGSAVIRFIPTPSDKDSYNFTRYWEHWFKGPGGIYNEKSLTTLGKPDPVSDANKVLWDTDDEANQKTVRQRKRKLSYVANIYVVKDPAKPENEGKVFLFKFGKKIFDKMLAIIQPEEGMGETPINPFDFHSGCNFHLKVCKVMEFPNYDQSKFLKQSVLGDFDDNQLEKIWRSGYELYEFTDPTKYKSYEELEKKFNAVIGNVKGNVPEAGKKPANVSKPVTTAEDDDESETVKALKANKTKRSPVKKDKPATTDDVLDEFQSLIDMDDEDDVPPFDK